MTTESTAGENVKQQRILCSHVVVAPTNFVSAQRCCLQIPCRPPRFRLQQRSRRSRTPPIAPGPALRSPRTPRRPAAAASGSARARRRRRRARRARRARSRTRRRVASSAVPSVHAPSVVVVSTRPRPAALRNTWPSPPPLAHAVVQRYSGIKHFHRSGRRRHGVRRGKPLRQKLRVRQGA